MSSYNFKKQYAKFNKSIEKIMKNDTDDFLKLIDTFESHKKDFENKIKNDKLRNIFIKTVKNHYSHNYQQIIKESKINQNNNKINRIFEPNDSEFEPNDSEMLLCLQLTFKIFDKNISVNVIGSYDELEDTIINFKLSKEEIKNLHENIIQSTNEFEDFKKFHKFWNDFIDNLKDDIFIENFYNKMINENHNKLEKYVELFLERFENYCNKSTKIVKNEKEKIQEIVDKFYFFINNIYSEENHDSNEIYLKCNFYIGNIKIEYCYYSNYQDKDVSKTNLTEELCTEIYKKMKFKYLLLKEFKYLFKEDKENYDNPEINIFDIWNILNC